MRFQEKAKGASERAGSRSSCGEMREKDSHVLRALLPQRPPSIEFLTLDFPLSHCCQGCHPPLSRIVLLLIQGLYGTLFGKTSVMTLSAILSFIIGMGGGRDRDLWIREKKKKTFYWHNGDNVAGRIRMRIICRLPAAPSCALFLNTLSSRSRALGLDNTTYITWTQRPVQSIDRSISCEDIVLCGRSIYPAATRI
jgi:hypothetical protein